MLSLQEFKEEKSSEDKREVWEAGQAVLTELRQEEEVRFWADAASNFGHQSSTVQLARRLVELIREEENALKTVTIVCANEAVQKRVNGLLTEEEKKLFYTTTTYWSSWWGELAYGFTGATDRPLSDHFTDILKVRNTVCLQPFRWHAKERVEWKAESSQVKQQVLRIHSRMVKIGYDTMWFAAKPSESSPSEGTPCEALLSTIKNHNSTHKTDPIFFCPIYGLAKGNPLGDEAELILRNLIQGYVELISSSKFVNKVILVDLTPEPYQTKWGEIAAWLTESDLAPKFEFDVSEVISGTLVNVCLGDQRGLKAAARMALDAKKSEDTKGHNEIEKQLLVCNLSGRKPQSVMSKMFASSTLPPVFEGQGTASDQITLGRPFFKVTLAMDKPGDPPKVWHGDYLRLSGHEEIADGMQDIANTLIDKGFKPAAFAEWAQAAADPEGGVWRYFKEWAAHVNQPKNHRLVYALGLLKLLRDGTVKIERGSF